MKIKIYPEGYDPAIADNVVCLSFSQPTQKEIEKHRLMRENTPISEVSENWVAPVGIWFEKIPDNQ